MKSAIEWRITREPVSYPEAVQVMEQQVKAIIEGRAPELVWLLEHPPIYTGGTSAQMDELLDPNALPVFRTGRGGRYTYHGPGQRIGYVIVDLNRRGRDLRRYVYALEEWLIQTLAAFGVTGERRAGRVGIWVVLPGGGESKIAAIGVRVRRWITFHGVSLNVDPDLSRYGGIVPCGIAEHGVTSLAALGIRATIEDVDAVLQQTFEEVFGGSNPPELQANSRIT